MESLSKKQINKIGDSIRQSLVNGDDVTISDLEKLQGYRISFKEALKIANEELNLILQRVDKSGIITYRIKRIESIFSKLKRFPQMNLARMHDIAGARCILQNEKKVYVFIEELKKSSVLEIKDVDDYIANPKVTGYKSIHLTCSCMEKYIEIQVRDETQHAWATLVEITDVIYKTKIKEKDNDCNTGLKDFLRIFSKSKNLTLQERKSMNEVLEKTKFIQKLTNTFSKNAIKLRKYWCSQKIDKGSFYVFEVDKKNKPKINIYKDFSLAEEKYFSSFTNDIRVKEKNLVMAYVSDDNFEMISKAYSNYVLIKHDFYMRLSNILSNDSGDDSVNEKSYALLQLCFICRNLVNLAEYNIIIKSRFQPNKKYDEWWRHVHKEIKLSGTRANYKVRKFDVIFLTPYLFKIFIKLFFIAIRIRKIQRKIKT